MSNVTLADLKNYLDITYNDDATDAKLNNILQRASNTINQYAGTTVICENENFEGQLLLDCCRYMFNNCFEDFQTNYLADIICLTNKYDVEEYDEENSE